MAHRMAPSVFQTWPMRRVLRQACTSSSTRSAVRRSASSRSAIRLPLRKKLRAAFSACAPRYTLPAFRRASSSSAGVSTITTSSARSKKVSGTVSCTRMPVMAPTTSFRLSRCCTLSVEYTLMPWASSSSTSCQRLGWREPGTLECASSSTSTSAGWRASAASRSNSGKVRPRCSTRRGSSAGSPVASACVSLRPWVSITPASTSTPSACSLLAACSMA